jgi:hypothetical protein
MQVNFRPVSTLQEVKPSFAQGNPSPQVQQDVFQAPLRAVDERLTGHFGKKHSLLIPLLAGLGTLVFSPTPSLYQATPTALTRCPRTETTTGTKIDLPSWVSIQDGVRIEAEKCPRIPRFFGPTIRVVNLDIQSQVVIPEEYAPGYTKPYDG